jgi:hypothetical protein
MCVGSSSWGGLRDSEDEFAIAEAQIIPTKILVLMIKKLSLENDS